VDDAARCLVAERGVQRKLGLAELAREAADALGAAGRALVELRVAGGERLGVGAAVGITAARALRLRQERVEALRKRRDACGRRRGRRDDRDGGTHRPDYPFAVAAILTVLRALAGDFAAADVAVACDLRAGVAALAGRPARSCSKRAMKSRTCG